MNNIEIQLKAKEAFDFLNNHPAFDNGINNVFGDAIWFWMAKCCKHGISSDNPESVDIRVYWEDKNKEKNWERFKDRIEEENKEDTNMPKELWSIDLPYEEVYGEPWKFDHIEYWYETTFFVFTGDPYNNDWMKPENWNRYAGPEGGANSFDEMLIDCADAVRKEFGNFDAYKDMHTQEELENHKNNMPFNFIPCEDRKGYSEMKNNPAYKHVTSGEINLRWLQWYSQTESCKKHWGDQFNEFMDKLKE